LFRRNSLQIGTTGTSRVLKVHGLKYISAFPAIDSAWSVRIFYDLAFRGAGVQYHKVATEILYIGFIRKHLFFAMRAHVHVRCDGPMNAAISGNEHSEKRLATY